MADAKNKEASFSVKVRDEACEFICDSGIMYVQELAGFVYGCICMNADLEKQELSLKIGKRGQVAKERVLSNLQVYFDENGIACDLDQTASILNFEGVLAELLYTELIQLPQQREDDMCRALLRGLFIGGGTISSPDNQHYFDVSSPEKAPIVLVQKFLDNYDIKSNIIQRKNRFVLYVKSGDSIADILKLMGTTRAAMYYEEVLCTSIASNLSNRAYNCYSANVNKFITRKLRVQELILEVDPSGKLGWAPEEIRSIAETIMDEQNGVFSLTELGSRMNPPIGKSGAAHRLDRLERLLEEIIARYK